MSIKTKVYLIVGVGILIFFSILGYKAATTRSHSPKDTVRYVLDDVLLEMVYCRPYKKDRLIFGEKGSGALEYYGEYWRTGANEATTFEVNQEIYFGDKPLNAGRYSFYTIPNEQEWEIVLNREADRWGLWEPDYSLDAVKIKAPVVRQPEVLEQFTISMEETENGILIHLKWDDLDIAFPVRKRS
ncbi:DUF2911 domain-containing protein [Rapidithrix thailandica]|uniref:DUF2911 domain-containing protein n=1 Tax=Rapidithrix thailandica TaxID=413964 RepID=A0AAW9S841_9BACT